MAELNISVGRNCEICGNKSGRLANLDEKSVCMKCYEMLKDNN